MTTVKNTSTATSHQTFGYKVTASMATGATTANLYLDGDETSEYYMAPVEDGTLSDNTWGYTLEEESEDYLSIPLATDPAIIVKGNDNIEDESVDIYYTIRVDKNLPAGTYTGELEYNIDPAIEYMQDLATLTPEEKSTLLANMTQDEQYILKDNRDEKSYYISKLADDNVWMTQNLDLDLDSQTTLTPENTNIFANWTPANSTIAFTGTTVPGWQNDYNVPSSSDPGDVYYYTSGDNDSDVKYNSLAECEAAGYTDCIHYHAGNYYNWSAAVASNDTSSMTEAYGNAPDSICPAGWRLPKARSAESWTKGNEASNLLSSYDWLVGDEYIHTYYSEVGYGYYYQSGGFVAIRSNPLWLVRAGSIGGDGSLSRGGEWSEYASSTIINDFALFTELEIGYEQNAVLAINMLYKYRSSGYSIRCIAE